MNRGIECAAWGVVARDPELKTGKSGTPYCSVNIGVTIGQDAETGKDILQWVKVVSFKEVAQQAARTLTKGSRAYFEGSLTLSTWRTAEGQERTDLNVRAWKLEKVAAIGKSRPPREASSTRYQAPIEQRRPEPTLNDDLPW